MILKVYEVNPLTCPICQAEMRIIAFLTDYAVVERIINHLKLTFEAERPPPLTWSIRKFLWTLRQAQNIFHYSFIEILSRLVLYSMTIGRGKIRS
jgi:hypothetical protein